MLARINLRFKQYFYYSITGWLNSNHLLKSGTFRISIIIWLWKISNYFIKWLNFSANTRLNEILIGLLHANGNSEIAWQFAKNVSVQRQRLLEKKIPKNYEGITQTDPKYIYISGYFYSGSGAVLDYLMGFEKSVKWSPSGGEVRVVKFPGGLADLRKRIEQNGRLSKSDVVDFFLHISGCFVLDVARGTYSKFKVVNKASSCLIKDPRAAAYVHKLHTLYQEIDRFAESEKQDIEVFEDICRKNLDQALKAAALSNGCSILLVDQIATAWKLPIARLLPPGTFIIVHRDPRDQFVEANKALNKPGRTPWTARKFTKIYLKRRKLVEDSIKDLSKNFGHQFIQISFEDFVIDHDKIAMKLKQKLSLENHAYSDKKRNFWPDISVKNIGKHKYVLTNQERKILESKLIKYFHKAAN